VANAGETDPEKIAEMIKVAYDARDYMFHELVQVEFDAKKGKHGTSSAAPQAQRGLYDVRLSS
jgi:hypothetical protein